ncbi:MAG: YbgC/FadM family acyl-CoA thioesterase [Rubrivivax sp.]
MNEPAPRAAFRFFEPLRVRWAEVDAQKIVFNGHYLMYLDTAVAGYWRALALPYEASMHALEGDLYVRKSTLGYEGSARYDDRLEVGLRCARVGTSSMVFDGAVFRGAQRLVAGELVYVFADPATQTSKPVPALLREILRGFEAGEPMVQVRLGTWSELGAAARTLRTAVFVDEQRIPAALEPDADDATALHALALNRLGDAVGTGRLVQSSPAVARIGRMAVTPPLRGSGIGATLVQAFSQAALARGCSELELHAQATAVAFYRRLGFQPRGEPFVEAGLVHQAMALAL